MTTTEEKVLANVEEVQPRKHSAWEEVPLMIFTLLGQMAVGGFWVMFWMFSPLWALVQYDATILRSIPSLVIGASLGMGMLASFAHLGTKKNAWRMLAHLKKSWLSREILFTLLFGAGWLYTTCEMIFLHKLTIEVAGITATLGLGLVYSMAQVYRLATMPAWNTRRTNAGFLVSACLLGFSVMSPLLAYESRMTGIHIPVNQWMISNGIILLLLLVQLVLMSKKHSSFSALRIGWLLFGMVLTIIGILWPSSMNWLGIFILISVACEEGIGRWLFYKYRA